MTKSTKRWMQFSVALLIVPVVAWHAFGLRLNHTPSVPTGIWYSVERSPSELSRGDVVSVCLDDAHNALYRDRGYLRWAFECEGTEALLKPVGAVAGDRYLVTEAGIQINGELIPDTAPLRADDRGRPLQWAGAGWLAPGYVFLISRFPASLDSRYFGPVPISQVRARMEPLWTWH